MTQRLRCFTAYDVRGRVPDELNPEISGRIGLAFADQFGLAKVVIGRDMRLSSPEISEALVRVLTGCGIDVIDIGLAGTEEVYHAVLSGADNGVEGGIMVTASHNPADYNGLKFVQRGARPVSEDGGLLQIRQRAESENWFAEVRRRPGDRRGTLEVNHDKTGYLARLLSVADPAHLPPLKIVVNPGNGCAGPIIDLLDEHLPCSFIRLHHEPDGTFPNGVPNPLLPEKREDTARAVRQHGADLGLAWDGDFDRCFFYDETGRFIEGYYMVGLLAEAMLGRCPGASILHDPRLIWNTQEVVRRAGGTPVLSRTGHAFIKEKMREADAVYGGEMSAHHYFRDFGYCDSGMIPWLLVVDLLGRTGRMMSRLVDERMQAFPVSGEINSTVDDPDLVIEKVRERYGDGELDLTDGVSISFADYRFNLRKSNTEPVLRLNVETRGNPVLLKEKTGELLALIRGN